MSEQPKDEHVVTVAIPASLVEKIRKRIQGTPFPTVAAYVSYVLSEVLTGAEEDSGEGFSKEDEERVKERLRALGYLE